MSTTFSVTRDDIIVAALRGVGALDKGEEPDTEDISDCAFSLNLILKSWISKGMPLWKVVTIVVPVVPALDVYTIGPTAHGTGAVSTDRPLRILEAFLRNSANIDKPLDIIARSTYNELGMKFPSASSTNFIYYNPGTVIGSLTVYPPCSDSTSNIYLTCQVPLADVNTGTDTLDFPSECFHCLKWCLEDEIAEDYHCSDAKIARIERKAKQYKDDMEAWSVEEADMYIQHDSRPY